MKCLICEKNFEKNNQLKIHINRYHPNDKIENEILYLKSLNTKIPLDLTDVKNMYLDGYTVNEIKEKYGIDVSNYILLSGIKRTAKESKKTKKYKEKIEKTLIERYGVKNLSQSEEIKKKKKNTFLKNYGYENNFNNKKTRDYALSKIDYDKTSKKMKESLMAKYGKDITNPAQIEWVKKKLSKTQKERLSKLSTEQLRELTEKARSKINYVSKQELRIQSILNDLNITYTANGFLYSYNWDLIFKNKTIIEVQGDFWHGNPKLYKETDILLNGLTVKDVWEKDQKKLKLVESKGYKVYYLWESDINNMTDIEILNKLKQILC
jgi:G:T-mismatch repair DNA endonuclease (very short patch repair protein)